MSNEFPLSPLGAARVRFLRDRGRSVEPAPGYPVFPRRIAEAALSREGGPELLQLAWELARCAPTLDPEGQRSLLLLAVALLSAQSDGSTRLSLAPESLVARLGPLGALPEEIQATVRLVDAALRGGPGAEVIGRSGEYKPLVVEGNHLYAQRMLGLEDRVVGALRARLDHLGAASPGDTGAAERALAEVLSRPASLGGKPVRLTREQRRAVLAAVTRPLAAISGGPGTGKTSIVVTILRVLLRLGFSREAIALAAPTGKAAHRMGSSIAANLRGIADPAPEDRALLDRLPEARTLHRLLGYSPAGDRFRHHENNRLAEEVVIVDEASMIDLFVFDRLVRAVRPEAHLVLLGDADQLPSVEAGAVFRELLPPDDADADPRYRSAVRLTESFRMDPGQPEGMAILTVARAIHAGRLDGVLPGSGMPAGAADPLTQAGLPPPAGEAVTATGIAIERRARAADVEFTKVELLDGGAGKRKGGEAQERKLLLERWFGLHASVDRWSDRIFHRSGGKFGEADERELEEAFRHHGSFRILCLVRGHGGGTGVEAVNAALHELAGAKNPGPGPGEPVLVRRNDYERELFNGDQGLVLRVKDGTGKVRPMAVFPGQEGYRAFPLDAMRGDLDLAWAMTVHRSQGSEFERVLVFLPEQDGPLLTREILYTAATRAKRSVVFVGSADLLRVAADRPIRRDSGIGERLAAAGPDDANGLGPAATVGGNGP